MDFIRKNGYLTKYHGYESIYTIRKGNFGRKENNNNQEMNFEKFYENMLNSLYNLNHEISLTENELNDFYSTVKSLKILKTCISIAAIMFSPVIFDLIDNNLPLVSILLAGLFALVEILREIYLSSNKNYLQFKAELQAKIAEKEALLAVCNSFGIEIPESLEDDELAR